MAKGYGSNFFGDLNVKGSTTISLSLFFSLCNSTSSFVVRESRENRNRIWVRERRGTNLEQTIVVATKDYRRNDLWTRLMGMTPSLCRDRHMSRDIDLYLRGEVSSSWLDFYSCFYIHDFKLFISRACIIFVELE